MDQLGNLVLAAAAQQAEEAISRISKKPLRKDPKGSPSQIGLFSFMWSYAPIDETSQNNDESDQVRGHTEEIHANKVGAPAWVNLER